MRHMEFVQLHVVSKNLRSIKSSDRFHDFVAEVDRYQFDLLLVAETWRCEQEENFLTADGHRLFLSGGSVGRHGVGIVVKRSLYAQMSNVVWSATLTHAAMTPFAATLLGEATPNLYNVDTNPVNWSQLLAETPPDPPSSSRPPPPPA